MARYLFENLGPEKFQDFCQALMIRDFPDLQCFPVGQPDGGRDGLSRGDSDIAPTVVLQVKFKRLDEGESAEWMIKALDKEKSKVERLANKGAQRYVMMTNARPTGHDGGGRIDRVQEWLDANFPIPAICLWRNDLERRLEESESKLKPAYPAVLTGEDALTLIVAAQIGPDRERISRALKAFTQAQYQKDTEVKFRQAELANSLLTLFVDVPVDVTPLLWERSGRTASAETLRSIRFMAARNDDERNFAQSFREYLGPPMTANAADLLLDSEIQAGLPWIVLEGAPGQGKSTLAQYVCQVHRAKYLNKTEFLRQVAEKHARAAFRLPIKVDLRDFAAYLDGRPFLGEDDPRNGPRTLERFLAALVSIQSGGLEFSADDVVETAARVPLLLFLDGLDEVADLRLRGMLIERVLEGLNRLKENGSDTQVVVTSRPSLFGRTAKFPKAFVRLGLAPISLRTIGEYASKWTVAKNLSQDQAEEVKGILHEKLALGHIRELTRNPMQLTILLSLIDSVGYSLPDVRTDLYREYMRLFMTREAEKSPVVRQHRHLLLEIVEYLAWRLQCEAESNGSSGSIGGDELRRLVAERLMANQQDTAILDDLFTGGIERVYVLVQRVEGLYEFEVQPLREYFAAKYLYSSAPVSHFRNQVVHGDRAQRFEAIAINPYWANVARFYAGFYEPGEIGALSSSLRELVKSKDLVVAISARSIGAALLADWIFRSKKYIQDEVIELVFDPLGVKLASTSALPGFVGASLDEECGRQHLAELLYKNHVVGDSAKVSGVLCGLLRENGGEGLLQEFQSWIASAQGPERTRRLDIACKCGAFEKDQSNETELLFFSDTPSSSELQQRARSIVRYGPSLLGKQPALAETAVESLLAWGGYNPMFGSNEIATLAWFLTGPMHRRRDIPTSSADDPTRKTRYQSTELVQSVVQSLRNLPMNSGGDAGGSFSFEDRCDQQLVLLKEAFGDRWALYRLAILNAGVVKISVETRGADPTAPDTTMFTKALMGRAWRGRASWWEDRFSTSDGYERLFWLALLLSWSPSKTISRHLPLVNELVNELEAEDFERLLDVLVHAAQIYEVRGLRGRGPVAGVTANQSKLAHVLLVALGAVQREQTPRNTDDDALNSLLEKYEFMQMTGAFPGWKGLSPRKMQSWIDLFSKAWREDRTLADSAQSHLYRSALMSPKIAEKVLLSVDEHSYELVEGAYAVLQAEYKPVSLQQVAADQNWTYD